MKRFVIFIKVNIENIEIFSSKIQFQIELNH